MEHAVRLDAKLVSHCFVSTNANQCWIKELSDTIDEKSEYLLGNRHKCVKVLSVHEVQRRHDYLPDMGTMDMKI